MAGFITTGLMAAGYLTGRFLQGECPNPELKTNFNQDIN